jgi:hypothetical protein
MSALSTKPILGRSIIVFQQGVSKEAETETADGRTRVLHCRHKRELSEFATRNSPVDMLWYPSSDCEAEATFLRSLIDRVSLQRLAVRIDLSQNLAELICSSTQPEKTSIGCNQPGVRRPNTGF